MEPLREDAASLPMAMGTYTQMLIGGPQSALHPHGPVLDDAETDAANMLVSLGQPPPTERAAAGPSLHAASTLETIKVGCVCCLRTDDWESRWLALCSPCGTEQVPVTVD